MRLEVERIRGSRHSRAAVCWRVLGRHVAVDSGRREEVGGRMEEGASPRGRRTAVWIEEGGCYCWGERRRRPGICCQETSTCILCLSGVPVAVFFCLCHGCFFVWRHNRWCRDSGEARSHVRRPYMPIAFSIARLAEEMSLPGWVGWIAGDGRAVFGLAQHGLGPMIGPKSSLNNGRSPCPCRNVRLYQRKGWSPAASCGQSQANVRGVPGCFCPWGGTLETRGCIA